jgi:hypothetical protein
MTEKIVIIYQPGFAGHLLTYLFSLDNSTAFIKPESIKIDDTLTNRLNCYSFDNAVKFDHWSKFHLFMDNFAGPSPHLNSSKIVYSIHPNDAAYGRLYFFDKILLVTLSYNDFCNFWLVETKKNWRDFPIIIKEDVEKENIIKNKYSPIEINLDCFLDTTTWFDEYVRINKLLNLPVITAAEELYDSWYKVRVLPYIEKFKTLTPDQKKFYCTARINLENNIPVSIDGTLLGSQINKLVELESLQQLEMHKEFVDFYNLVRGADWPDCGNINDFYNIPAWIHAEIELKFKPEFKRFTTFLR